MVNTGLLILTSPAKITKLLPVIKKHVLKRLYIQYLPEKNSLLSSNNYPVTSSKWNTLRSTQSIASIYALTMNHTKLDVRVLLTNLKNPAQLSIINTKRPVEIVIFDRTYSQKDANAFIQDCLANTSMDCSFVTCDEDVKEDCGAAAQQDDSEEFAVYKSVVLGGTFDRIHAGHKILFSEALLRCTEKLTVGVADTSMLLSSKTLWELIEPVEKRIIDIKDFLEDVDQSLKYDVVPIYDIYGPTKSDPNMDLLVVSEETVKGGDKVNQLRQTNGLKKLDLHVVKIVPDEAHKDHEETKVSSSNYRKRLLGTRLKEPNLEGKCLRPYIIGLTGGIASGKSSIAEKLQKLGACLLNCDKVAHELYAPGNQCHRAIVEEFGKDILLSDNTINRKALGDIVFNNKDQLDKLNGLVWPAILEESKKRIADLAQKGCRVIVMEAAVLIQARWQNVCHEIWTCIIPEDEAIQRVMDRNKVSREEAQMRIKVQPSNLEQVHEAHVVLSTMWDPEVTQEQVQHAWNELNEFLDERDNSKN